MASKIDYLTRDYESFRADLISQIPRKTQEWTDFSSSDPGVVLLELLAYGLDIVSFYQDRTANEVYLPTANQRQSVIDICAPLGYRLKPATPSTTPVVFEVASDANNALLIPAGFQVSTSLDENEEPIIFETDRDLIIPAGNTGLEQTNGSYNYTVTVTQGITVNNDIVGSGNGQAGQTFKLRYPSVIDGSLSLYVNEGTGFTLWRDVTKELVQDTEDGRHYWTEIDADGYTWVNFGSGEDGRVAPNGVNNIQATYRVGGGASTNVGSNKINRLVTSLSRIKRVFNPSAATGGTDQETLDEARRNLPKYLRSNSRAVTRADYEYHAEQVEGVLKAHAERDPDAYNMVHVYVLAKDGVSYTTLLDNVYDHIDELKTITSELTTQTAPTVALNIDMTVTIDDRADQETMKTFVEQVITDRFNPANREFGQGEQTYKIYTLVGDVLNVTGLSITKFTTTPTWLVGTVSGNPTLSAITVNSTNTLRGTWKIKMTSATAFTAYFDSTGAFEGSEVAKGNGTLGTPFTSTGGEVTFTITAGGTAMQTNDYWTFKTQPYNGDAIIEAKEFLVLGNLNVTMNGGMA